MEPCIESSTVSAYNSNMNELNLYNEVGTIIKKYRTKLQMSQRELASGICSPAHITHIENGNRSPNAVILFYIADKLKIPVNELFSPYSRELNDMMSNLSILTMSNASRNKIMEYINFIEDNYQIISTKNDLLLKALRIYIGSVEGKKFKDGVTQLLTLLEEYSTHHAYISPTEFAVENAAHWLHYLAGNIDYCYMKLKESYYKINGILAFENFGYITKFFIQIGIVSIDRQDYKSAIRYLDEGIENNKMKATHALLPELLYHKGEALYLMKKESEGKDLMREAYRCSEFISQRPDDFFQYISNRMKSIGISIEL